MCPPAVALPAVNKVKNVKDVEQLASGESSSVAVRVDLPALGKQAPDIKCNKVPSSQQILC